MNSSSNSSHNKRYRSTILMVVRFGLQHWWLNKTRFFRSKQAQQQKRSRLYTKQARAFKNKAMKMGGLIIKLGQHLSTHIEMMPPEFITELTDLQDSVSPVPTSQIKSIIQEEFGKSAEEVYATFEDEPIAAASLAQVHKAQLESGEEVAVKVLRPGIHEIIQTDLRSLRTALTLLEKRTKIGQYMDTDMFYNEFEKTVNEELDLCQERQNAEAFRENLKSVKGVYIPQTYEAYSTKSVLTLEFISGLKISEVEKLTEEGIDTHKIAVKLIETYLQMILNKGLFHADPHPGNVFVQADGTIVLLDFGMVGRVTPSMREGFVSLATAIAIQNEVLTAKAFKDLGFLRQDADTRALEKALRIFFSESLSEMSSTNISQGLQEELGEFMRSQPFQLPDNITFLIKAVMTIIETSTALDPDIDLVEEAKPFAQAFITEEDFSLPGLFEKAKAAIPQVLTLIKTIPSVIEKLDSGDITVRISSTQEKRIIDFQDLQTQRITRSILGAVLALGGMVLLGSSYENIPYHMQIAGVALVLGILILLAQTRKGKARKRRSPHSRGRS